jgi:hypothetical protein
LTLKRPAWTVFPARGIIDAFAALQALGVPGFANPELGAFTATENPGDGDGQIEPGESAKIDIQLKNTGVQGATGITATPARLRLS